jgi:superfamily II DNA or RNA helicase
MIDNHFKREVEKRASNIDLRIWQKEVLKSLRDKRQKDKDSRVFVAEVCPGGGKTMLGCLFAAAQYTSGSDLDTVVICLVPSVSIKKGWVKTAKSLGFVVTGESDNFTEDVVFRVVTYAGAKRSLDNIPANSRILLICDEYHHAERDKEWGNALESIASISYNILMLSGTPWRTDGYIALLQNNNYYQNGIVVPDYSYNYASDLKSPTRGTVPLHFDLIHSRAYVGMGDSKQVVSEYNPPLTDEDWEECSRVIPQQNNDLGKHVGCENVYRNETAIKVLERVRERLDQARQWHCPHVIALVVARNKREADNIGKYLRDKYAWTVQVIHSGTDEIDTKASKKIEHIQDELQKPNPKVPDAIVSVGMISEGVDIPAIKVVGYLSAISTMLYIIQVIFRAARRIPKLYDQSGRRIDFSYYDDGFPTMTKSGYIVAPAEPTFVYLSANLKKQIKMVVNESGNDNIDNIKDNPLVDTDRPVMPYMTETDGYVEVVNSCLIPSDVQEAIKYLQDCPSVIAEFCGQTAFRQWIDAVLGSNSESQQKAVIERIRVLKDKYADEISEIRRNESPKEPSINIDYDAQIAEAKAEIKRLTNLIRWSSIKSPLGDAYRDLKDDEGYRVVSQVINRKIGIQSLSQATLATRVKWIESARKYYEENING